MKTTQFLPEGYAPSPQVPLPLSTIEDYIAEKAIVEGLALRCDSSHNLHVSLFGYDGVIPSHEAVHPKVSGSQREIAILSRVGQAVSCVITGVTVDGGGKPHLQLSRRAAQEMALSHLLKTATCGTILRGRITHLASFGAFVDIGCGVIALLPLCYISVSRISHPAQRFTPGQRVRVVVRHVDEERCRFTLSHRELLGTWLQNASRFSPGETVTGFVRGVMEYGCFVELTPNLCGLADEKEDIQENDAVTVFIRSIRPEQMKIKLQIMKKASDILKPPPLVYHLTDGQIQQWQYAPSDCEKDFPITYFF